MRRCGKGYLLKNLYRDWLCSQGVRDEQVVVKLDDDRFESQRDQRALREYVEGRASDEGTQYHVILDEIQMVEDFEGAVISLNNHPNYDVYITGSNSKFLSRDISTRFKGRGTEICVHPLSYRERNGEGRQVYKQREVDFVARLGSREYYVQVMDRVPSGRHGENEYESLRKVPGSFRKPAVVNALFKEYVNEDGILVISLEDFLLNQRGLDL